MNIVKVKEEIERIKVNVNNSHGHNWPVAIHKVVKGIYFARQMRMLRMAQLICISECTAQKMLLPVDALTLNSK